MKKLASSNVVISPTVKSSSTSLSMQKKPETEQVQQKLEQYLLSRYHFRFNLLTEQTECCKKDADTPIYKVISQAHPEQPVPGSTCTSHQLLGQGCKPVRELGADAGLSSVTFLYEHPSRMGRQGPSDSAGTTHIYERFLGEQFPPLDAGRNCPVERTHGPVRQRCGPHAGEQRAREMQIHFLRIADARFVERLLYGQLRTDRTGRMRAEAGFLRTD